MIGTGTFLSIFRYGLDLSFAINAYLHEPHIDISLTSADITVYMHPYNGISALSARFSRTSDPGSTIQAHLFVQNQSQPTK